MIDVGCTLISKTYRKDEDGNIIVENGIEQFDITRVEVPIIDVQSVWQSEFYKANEQGLRPSIRIVISTLNYNDEKELVYMNNSYSVIRTENRNIDEVVLICQRKVKDV